LLPLSGNTVRLAQPEIQCAIVESHDLGDREAEMDLEIA